MRGALLSSVPLLAFLTLAPMQSLAGQRSAALTPQMPVDALTTAPPPPIADDTPKLPETAATFRPAPIPDPDVDPPQHVVQDNRPSISPAFFSQKQLSDGDGYSNASSVDAAQDKRRQPAAGLNWSVPVK